MRSVANLLIIILFTPYYVCPSHVPPKAFGCTDIRPINIFAQNSLFLLFQHIAKLLGLKMTFKYIIISEI